jgi:hypothetical protein
MLKRGCGRRCDLVSRGVSGRLDEIDREGIVEG